MGVRQASGEGAIPLAGSQGTGEHIDAAGGTDDAVERHGPEAVQATAGLVAEAACGVKISTAKDNKRLASLSMLEYPITYYSKHVSISYITSLQHRPQLPESRVEAAEFGERIAAGEAAAGADRQVRAGEREAERRATVAARRRAWRERRRSTCRGCAGSAAGSAPDSRATRQSNHKAAGANIRAARLFRRIFRELSG